MQLHPEEARDRNFTEIMDSDISSNLSRAENIRADTEYSIVKPETTVSVFEHNPADLPLQMKEPTPVSNDRKSSRRPRSARKVAGVAENQLARKVQEKAIETTPEESRIMREEDFMN